VSSGLLQKAPSVDKYTVAYHFGDAGFADGSVTATINAGGADCLA
jgi:hypothetical protein